MPASNPTLTRAEDGTRTRYLQLGKLSLYQVSYFREWGEIKEKMGKLTFHPANYQGEY